MKREINEYLFVEFGLDADGEDLSSVSEVWPFQLDSLDTVHLTSENTAVYGFEHDGEKYYAVAGNALDFYSASGIDLKNFRREIQGRAWLADHAPVDLNTSRGNHPVVPRIPDRKEHIESLVREFDGNRPYSILIGLFLESSSQSIALVEFEEEDKAHIIGDNITLKNIPFVTASPKRRLAIGIGILIEKGFLA